VKGGVEMSNMEKIMLTVILGNIKHNIETSKNIDDAIEKARKGGAE
jgi:hypothetical protein